MKTITLKENKYYEIESLKAQGLEEALVFLNDNEIIETKYNKICFKYIGSIFFSDIHIFVIPKYRGKNYSNTELSLFYKAIMKFRNTSKLLEEDNNGIWDAVTEILQDYTENGYMKSYSKQIECDWSNPNWDKMFNHTPLYCQNNAPFWESPISTKTTLNEYSLKNLHDSIISFILHTFPVMTTFYPHLPHGYIPNTILVDKLKTEVQEQLLITAFPREQQIFRKTLAVIDSICDSECLLVGTKNPHIFWESICKCILNDQSEKWLEYFPKANWHIKNTNGVTKTHKPDIITVIDGITHIYDAKYYFTERTQPGIQDITKQILYEKCLRNIQRDIEICNAFVFPSEIPSDQLEKATGVITFAAFDNAISINTHHQYDIDSFKQYIA
ncbi:LlaJI family restriction endonuclease [Bacillus toyonensis]|uniref:LlaJI family restriction endonuclease n=1 Tax=Bacillus toyonensis TaxID=155322 RepID=UPI002E24F825|nr:LlaJI family restriction endonuclease [Bacillus toyonensis]